MNGVKKGIRSVHQALAGAPPNRFVSRADVKHFSFGRISHPEDFADVLGQLAETLLAFAQDRLCPLTLDTERE
jgi:hypothetical protein